MLPGVVALNAASGSVLWTYHTAVFFVLGQPVIVSNVLYLSEIAFDNSLRSATPDSKHTSDVLALRVTDGSVLRRYIPHSGKMFGAPMVSQHVLYLDIRLSAAKGQIPTAIVALDLETGMETWRSNQLQPFGGIDVIVSQGQIYAYSPWDYSPATLVVFQASNGNQLWNHPTNGYIYHVVADFN